METDFLSPTPDVTAHGLADGILRQRRNLLLASIIMPLFISGAVIIEQVNLLSTIIDIKSQASIGITIFFFYTYFLWRYWQYYREDIRAKAFRSTREGLLYDAEFEHFSELLRPKTECFEYEYYYPKFKTTDNYGGFENRELPNGEDDQNLGLFQKSRMMEINGLDDKYKEHYIKQVEPSPLDPSEISAIEADWKLVKKSSGNSRTEPIFETPVEYNPLFLGWIRFLVRVKFICVHPYFSDYQLPLLLAIISFAITAHFALPGLISYIISIN